MDKVTLTVVFENFSIMNVLMLTRFTIPLSSEKRFMIFIFTCNKTPLETGIINNVNIGFPNRG